MADSPDDRLDSWKGIAAYLGRNQRTAMRWAQELGLPVHRTPGTHHGSVFAYKREIDAWRVGSGVPAARSSAPLNEEPNETRAVEARAAASAAPNRRLRLVVLGRVAAVVLAGLVLFLSMALVSSRKPPVKPRDRVNAVTLTYDAVVAWHGRHELWRHEFTQPLSPRVLGLDRPLGDFVRIVHLPHAGRTVVIVVAPFRLTPNPGSSFETPVDCFSSSGKLLWSYVPREKFQFGAYELKGPWHVAAVYLSYARGKPYLWVSEEHYEWGNSFVVQLDLVTGHARLRYVNTGVLYALNEVKTASGTYLLAGGFNNEYSAPSMAVIDEKKPFAASPQTPGTRHQCVSCPPGVPDEYFVFPRTEINRAEGIYEDPVQGIGVSGDQVEVQTAEAKGRAQADAAYLFRTSPTIWPTSVRYDSNYDMLYRWLENKERIHYSLADSPERLHPQPIAVWTPLHDWAECNFRPPGTASGTVLPISRPPRYLQAAAPPP